MLEARLTAPIAEICTRIAEGIARLDEHVQRHQQTECVSLTCIVDQLVDGNKSAALRKGIVGLPEKNLLFLQVSSSEEIHYSPVRQH